MYVLLNNISQWILSVKLFILLNPDKTYIKTSFLITGLLTASNCNDLRHFSFYANASLHKVRNMCVHNFGEFFNSQRSYMFYIFCVLTVMLQRRLLLKSIVHQTPFIIVHIF